METLIREFSAKLEAGDKTAMMHMMAEDFVQEWPQSGERVTGRQGCLNVMTNYPGGMPQIKLGRISGEGDHWVVESTTTYPGGEVYFVVSLIETRDGLFVRQVDYFGPEFPAPEWREQWVEPIALSTE